MKKYVYSAENNAFYPTSMKEDYISGNCWPTDGVECDEDVFTEYTKEPPTGKHRGADKKGLPAWVDKPPLSIEEEIKVAEQQKATLLAGAQETISFWQTELQLGIISDEDKASLIAWMNYIKTVQAVDTSKAPDITWPVPPAA